MNFFETELKKITAKANLMKNQKQVGRACIGKLTEMITVKAEFATLGVADYYPAIRITLINRNEGKIDVIAIRFNDVWKNKDAIQAWTYGSETDWYRFRPTAADYTKIGKAINEYLENFAD